MNKSKEKDKNKKNLSHRRNKMDSEKKYTFELFNINAPTKNNMVYTKEALEKAVEEWNKHHDNPTLWVEGDHIVGSSRYWGHIEDGKIVQDKPIDELWFKDISFSTDIVSKSIDTNSLGINIIE